MAFLKRVNLIASSGEKLNGWIQDRCAGIGSTVRLREDDFGRDWTVSEAGDQLITEAQVDARHVLTVVDEEDAVPAAVTRKPTGKRLKTAALPASN